MADSPDPPRSDANLFGRCRAVVSSRKDRAPALADGHRAPAPEGAFANIVSPAYDGTVSNPVTIVYGLSGMGVARSGSEIEGTGHHHLLINTDPETLNLDEPLPANDAIRHFGGGQTQVTLDLPPGTHALRLLPGDWTHIPHNPGLSSAMGDRDRGGIGAYG